MLCLSSEGESWGRVAGGGGQQEQVPLKGSWWGETPVLGAGPLLCLLPRLPYAAISLSILNSLGRLLPCLPAGCL